MHERVTLSRDADAVVIPSGDPIELPKGLEAVITQSLGGSYTLMTPHGMMVRLSGREVEAIGKEPELPQAVEGEIDESKLEAIVWDTLKTCYDPEIPVNIVDLGLVYLCELEPRDDGSKKVRVKMTLTAPGCGMGPVLASDVRQKLIALPGISDADIEIVFDPVWDRSMMSEAAKLQLGMMW